MNFFLLMQGGATDKKFLKGRVAETALPYEKGPTDERMIGRMETASARRTSGKEKIQEGAKNQSKGTKQGKRQGNKDGP